jgi:hypothetical protein
MYAGLDCCGNYFAIDAAQNAFAHGEDDQAQLNNDVLPSGATY